LEPTTLLRLAVDGDSPAAHQLFELVYGELYGRARAQRRRWDGNLTVNTTALVHEAYIKLVDSGSPDIKDRAHFLAMASRAMRQVLLDYARRASAEKRGGDLNRATFADGELAPAMMDGPTADRLMDLENALAKLESDNPSMARVVECRFFGGMTVEETSVVLGVSTPTVKRRWAMARGWLFSEIEGEEDGYL
jgi:RNA polymerase sigma factor (TIGR02999 family)